MKFLSQAAAALFLASSTTTSVAQLDCSFQTETDISGAGDGSLLLRSAINQDDQTVTVQMEHTGEAWLGLAFSESGSMVPNVAAIGLPAEGLVERRNLGARALSGITTADFQTYSDASITQQDGTTTLTFTKPLVEDGEVDVTVGDNLILWAVGPQGNAFEQHATRGSTTVTLAECLEAGETSAPTAAATNAPTAAPGEGAVELAPGVFQLAVNLQEGIDTVFTTDENEGTLTVDMLYEGIGYIAFAWSNDQSMPGSVAAMAFPGDDAGVPQKWDLSARSAAGVVLASDDRQNLQDASYFQNETHTGMTFTKNLVDGDEPVVSLDGVNNFLYATGSDNTFAQHNVRNAFTLNFAEGGGVSVAAGPRRKLWLTHGILMATAWGLLVPLAVGSSIARRILPLAPGVWFQIHRGLNTLGVTFTIVAFGIAVYLLGDEQGDAVEHFTQKKHHTFGLVIFIFAFLQALSGILRPHAPAPAKEPSEDEVENGAEPEPAEEKTLARQAFEYQHKILGTVTMVLAWFNCDSGIEEYDTRFGKANLEGAFWAVVAVITFCTVGLAIMQQVKKS